jgi:hypothetical protein
VRVKIRLSIKRSENTKKSEIKKWEIGKIRKKELNDATTKKVTTKIVK